MPNASTPLLLGHESGGLSGVANSDVGNNGSAAAITVLQPPVILGTANFTATEPAAASASDTVVSMNSGTLNVSGVTLPGTLNFVMGATSAQAATNNDNNNNMDNASDDSNPVTIYR